MAKTKFTYALACTIAAFAAVVLVLDPVRAARDSSKPNFLVRGMAVCAEARCYPKLTPSRLLASLLTLDLDLTPDHHCG